MPLKISKLITIEIIVWLERTTSKGKYELNSMQHDNCQQHNQSFVCLLRHSVRKHYSAYYYYSAPLKLRPYGAIQICLLLLLLLFYSSQGLTDWGIVAFSAK